jgi:hypothetical protein
MGKTFDSITAEQREWISRQKLFFVATAPLSPNAHINCSPKGGETFRVLGDSEVAYLDLTGSGVETTAHLQENGRIVLMFCAFDGPPKIVRLHGQGEVVYPTAPEFERLARSFPVLPGIRSIIRVRVSRVSDSCGHGVPLYDFKGNRDILDQWATNKGEAGLAEYRRAKNARSVDGLPGYAG